MKNTIGSFPLGVCVSPEPPLNAARTFGHADYVHEILSHAGVCYSAIAIESLSERLPNLRVLVTIGAAEIAGDLAEQLKEWVNAGGVWVAVAGVCGMAELLGVEEESASYTMWNSGPATLGEGYLEPIVASHPMLPQQSIPLHFFNGVSVQTVEARAIAGVLDAHQRPTQRAAVTEMDQGDGLCLLIAPDVTGAVVRIQQGICITRDGVSSPDGTACRSDNVLKSDDGAVLDWMFDRQTVSGVPALSAFLQPVADQWRELLLRAIFYACECTRAVLPVLWLYPRDLPALAELSCDTDGNNEHRAMQLREILDEIGVNGTWCVMPPGYSSDTINAIRSSGHELAMHYDAMSDGCMWGEAHFDAAYKQVVEAIGGEPLVTNKNHFLRWEGDTEFFNWLEKRGIEFDQSKGASKTGESGFNFGTCQPYFPVAPDARLIDVLELPTPTQDLQVFAPKEIADPLLQAVLRHHGVLHMLFHPEHIERPGVADAIREVVEAGRKNGMEWWTARDINNWERARREAHWTDYAEQEGALRVSLETERQLPEANVMLLGPKPVRWLVNGRDMSAKTVTRWGFSFHSVEMTLEKDAEYSLYVTVSQQEAHI